MKTENHRIEECEKCGHKKVVYDNVLYTCDTCTGEFSHSDYAPTDLDVFYNEMEEHVAYHFCDWECLLVFLLGLDLEKDTTIHFVSFPFLAKENFKDFKSAIEEG